MCRDSNARSRRVQLPGILAWQVWGGSIIAASCDYACCNQHVDAKRRKFLKESGWELHFKSVSFILWVERHEDIQFSLFNPQPSDDGLALESVNQLNNGCGKVSNRNSYPMFPEADLLKDLRP